MSATDFLPRREANLLNWSIGFNNQINADPTAIGLTAAQAAQYNTLHNAFAAAYLLAVSPSTMGPPKTQAKNAALRALRTSARELAGIIRAHPGITAQQKSSLGLTVRGVGGKQTPFPRPSAPPVMDVVRQRGRSVTLRLRNAESPTRRARPVGVFGATLLVCVATEPPADPMRWSCLTQTTRTEFMVDLPRTAEPGDRVWLTAGWMNPRGQLGPLCQPIVTNVQFSALSRAA